MDVRISAIVLAGGSGRRMSDMDKGLIPVAGIPMVAHVIRSIEADVNEIIISCNRHIDEYKNFGYQTVTDLQPGYQGPLSGICSASALVNHELCLIVPCDMPYLPDGIVKTLLSELSTFDAISISVDGHWQPLVSLVRSHTLKSAENCLESGQHSVKHWLENCHLKLVEITGSTKGFRNINTPEQLGQ